MVDPGPGEEDRFLSSLSRISKETAEQERRKGKERKEKEKKMNSALKKIIIKALTLTTEDRGKWPRRPIGDCPNDQYSNTAEDEIDFINGSHLYGPYQSQR